MIINPYVFQTSPISPTLIKINVTSEGNPIDGATAILYHWNTSTAMAEFIESKITEADGSASFDVSPDTEYLTSAIKYPGYIQNPPTTRPSTTSIENETVEVDISLNSSTSDVTWNATTGGSPRQNVLIKVQRLGVDAGYLYTDINGQAFMPLQAAFSRYWVYDSEGTVLINNTIYTPVAGYTTKNITVP